MSACISSRGEYSSHELENGECTCCGYVDLDRVRAEAKVEALREAAAAVEIIDPAWDSALFVDGSYHPLPDWLRARADKLEATPMPATREARYLSGADRGKHVRLTVLGGKYTGDWELEGELLELTHWADGNASLMVLRDDGPARGMCIPPNTIVTITGKEA